jgi:hypothetical protein
VDANTGVKTAEPVLAAEFAEYQAKRKAEKAELIKRLNSELDDSVYGKVLIIKNFVDEAAALAANFGAEFDYTPEELTVMADFAALHLAGTDQGHVEDAASEFGLQAADFAKRITDLLTARRKFIVIAALMKRYYKQNVESGAKPEQLALFTLELRAAANKAKENLKKG